MQGKIVKGIAGFYYVHVVESGLYECKAKGVFRKEKIKPLVGDVVEIDVLDEEKKTGNIREIAERKNELIRPAVANIDQALVVFAITKPKPHFNLLDRFLIMMESKGIPVILCFNKQDIATDEEIQSIRGIYETCGYEVFFTSAMENNHVDELKEKLRGKTTAIAGPSGVGKSSLINLFQQNVQMETGSISEKIERGKHTTRHSELVWIEDNTYIMDTPGFSSLSLSDTIDSNCLIEFFPDLSIHTSNCKFSDCVHTSNKYCGVYDALLSGQISQSRYDNYINLYNSIKLNKERKK